MVLGGCGGEKFAGDNKAGPADNGVKVAADTPETEPPSEEGRYGGTFTDDSIVEPKTFNLWVAADAGSGAAVGNMFEPLIGRNGYTLEYQDRLAEMPQVSKDGLTYTFKLKPNLKWSDGKPITVDDVIFTFDVIYDENVQCNMREGLKVDVPDGKGGYKREPLKYRKIDDSTVEVKFPVPYAPALSMLEFPIAPRHKLFPAWRKGQPSESSFNQMWNIDVDPKDMVGSGPWLLQQYVPAQRMVYKPNIYYWKKGVNGQKLPFFDRYITLIVPDSNASTLKFRSGETDVLNIQHADYPLIKREEAKGDYTVRNLGPGWGSNYLSFNMNPTSDPARAKPALMKLFQDVRFRRAVSHAIDRQRICDTVFLGFAQPGYSPVSPVNKLFFNPDVPKYEFDLEKSRALLKEIGLRDSNGNDILEVGGQDIKFTIMTNSETKSRMGIATIVVDDLKKVGLQATAVPLSWPTVLIRIDAKPQPGQKKPPFNWEGLLLGFTGSPDPHDGRNVWQSSGNMHQWNPYQDKPATKWEAEIDEIFRKGAQELDPAKRKELYDRFQVIVAEELPLIHTVVPERLSALRNRFGNVKPGSLGLAWNIEEWYDKSAKSAKQ